MNVTKIGILTSSFPLTKDSTSGIFISRLIQHFSSQISPTVITPASDSQIEPDVSLHKYNVVSFRYAPWRWQILAHKAGGIPATLSNHNWSYFLIPFFLVSMIISCFRISKSIDLFHANWSINGFVAGLVGKITKKPVVITLRGSDVNRAKTSSLYRYILGLCIQFSQKIITVSDSLQESVQRLFPTLPASKICTIPNGVSDDFLNIPINNACTNGQIIKLITVGNLTKNKNIDCIVRSLHFLNNKQFMLTVIGNGPEINNIKHIIESLGLQNEVDLLGNLPADEIPAHLGNSDIFILASHSEGRPNVILEAMAAGIPVIASNIEGIKGMITNEETGLLFEAGNAKHLAEKILRLNASLQLRANIGLAGRSFIIKNQLVWSNTAKRYENIYNEILNANSQARA